MTVKSNVEVTRVEKVKAGKTDRVNVYYMGTDKDGNKSEWKTGALLVQLGEPTRSFLKELQARVPAKADLEILKDGDYWNLAQVAEAGSLKSEAPKPAYSSGYKKASNAAPAVGRLSDVEKGEGQQRGNVLTNATNLVCQFNAAYDDPMDAVKDIEKVARALYEVSKRLESNNSPENNIEQQKQHEQAHAADDFSVDDANSPDVGW